jgi:hypothetical protein
MDNNDSRDKNYRKVNIPLLVFDIILLPIHIARMIIIYFCGSKYNLRGFQFLDVIMHADNPYFNQEDCRVVNTIKTDYRIVIRDDSRIFPLDLDRYIDIKKSNIEEVTIGKTVCNNSKWEIASNECNNNNKPKLVESNNSSDKIKDTYIEGVNYFGNNENDIILEQENQDDILDSIRDELNNVFDN